MRIGVQVESLPGEVSRLRAQVDRMQGRRLDAPVIPTHPALAALLPGGGLRAGSAYSLAPSTSLLLAVMARASQDGVWCGVIGMPELGVEAAEQLGVDLSRLVLIPDPGARWVAVAATVMEVVPVVAVRPPSRVSDAETARLHARLRDRDAVLLVQGAWPQVEASIGLDRPEWAGVGAGHGYLSARSLTITVTGRRSSTPRSARMLLPDPSGGLAGAAVAADAIVTAPHAGDALRAAG